MGKNYYDILGVDKSVSFEELKRVYRNLCKKWHPDINKSHEAEEKFKEINEAYETLSDPQKREQYDNPNPFGNGFGSSGMNGFRDANGNMHFTWSSDGSDNSGFNPFDMFERMMGGRRGFRRQDPNAPRPGEDKVLSLTVKFMEAINGCKKTVRLNIEDNDKDYNRILKTITLEVKIPRGCPNGQRLRIPEQGNKGYNGGKNGDIYFIISIEEHPYFVRYGYDIGVKVTVPFETFVLGGKVKVPTLDGEVEMEIGEYSVPGTILTLEGKGSPIMNTVNSYGDLKAILELVMPTDLTDKERKALEKYRDERNK